MKLTDQTKLQLLLCYTLDVYLYMCELVLIQATKHKDKKEEKKITWTIKYAVVFNSYVIVI